MTGVESDDFGMAGSDVSAVTFDFAGGLTVDATVQNGWYFAWWPTLDDPASVQITTTSGADADRRMRIAIPARLTGSMLTSPASGATSSRIIAENQWAPRRLAWAPGCIVTSPRRP